MTELAKASEISRIFGTSEIVDFAAIALVFKDSAVTCRINIGLVINHATDIIFLPRPLAQALISKSAEQSFLDSAKMTTGKTNLSFVLNRIQDGNKWKSSLAKKLAQETMNSIGDRLGASAGDVVLLGLGPRESLVSYLQLLKTKRRNNKSKKDNGAQLESNELAP